MAYNAILNERIREAMLKHQNVEQKEMFGGNCFMLNGKMCIGVLKEEMMCRIGPDAYEEALRRPGAREMDLSGRPMKGYVFVGEDGWKPKKDFEAWIALCVAFNGEAKEGKKKRKKKV
jgi:hypothetical protein